ncbi:hypothetical protein JCM9152_1407 [Halalkalibacter hemicellulosilyticusJCM 9152]|uniref:Uncharacterized protein n=1 Tax=Halalkalibacter hemicellulosilyticusJCM 9152 TaxID=1236971 RepID=W4QD96_9BACI|nr:hypothetical protein JCM9152_1407 [Halalkalibacter hemicellulosilyticusJCM 9152]
MHIGLFSQWNELMAATFRKNMRKPKNNFTGIYCPSIIILFFIKNRECKSIEEKRKGFKVKSFLFSNIN